MSKNKDCFIFKDLYASYLDEEIEEETSEWVKLHLAECSECKGWVKNFDKRAADEYEDNKINDTVIEHEGDREKQVVKRAKLLLISSLVVVVILAIWMSLWIFA
jgi:predicted anti-sigma-YlaC factor YlaD